MRQAQILVVDDEAAFRDVLCEVLVKKGHTVRSGGTAAEALLQLEKGNFDLTICDLRLPDMSGLDLLRKCRETTPQMHFIMISAYGDIETAVEAVKLGADDYLTKPFLFDDILLRIERLPGKRRSAQYFTTDRFLKLFGLQTLADLPQSEELDRQ